MYVFLFEENIETNIHLEQLFICSQRHGRRFCSVQRLLDEIKQRNPLNVTSHIFWFDNFSLQLIILDDFMKLLVLI